MERTVRILTAFDYSGQKHHLATEEFISDECYYKKTIFMGTEQLVIEDYIGAAEIQTVGPFLPQLTIGELRAYFWDVCSDNMKLTMEKAGLKNVKIQKILEQKILYVCGGHEATFITEISKDSFCEIDLRMILDNTDFESHLMQLNTQIKNNTNEKGD